MQGSIRKKHSAGFKLKVALSAIKGDMTTAELCQKFGVAASQIFAWKKLVEENGGLLFTDKRQSQNQEETVEKLHATIGKLTVERDFLAKALNR